MRRDWPGGGSGPVMDESPWRPRATVAALCEREGRYLLVRERIDGREVYNQPAGHLEPDETLIDAVIRETLEETRYRFEPTALQAVYRYSPPDGGLTFLRFLFRGEVGELVEGPTDDEIIAVEWLDYAQVLACRESHRSPMVLQGIGDARARPGYPLDVISREFA